MTPTPQEIAARLSEAQKRLVLASEPDDITGEEGCGVDIRGADYRVARALKKKGLGAYTHGDGCGDMYWNFPLGLAVRTILETPDPGQCICTADYSGAWEMNFDCLVHNPPNSRLRNRRENRS